MLLLLKLSCFIIMCLSRYAWLVPWSTQWGVNGRKDARSAVVPSYRTKTHHCTLLSVHRLCVIETALRWDTHISNICFILLYLYCNIYVYCVFQGSTYTPSNGECCGKCTPSSCVESAGEMRGDNLLRQNLRHVCVQRNHTRLNNIGNQFILMFVFYVIVNARFVGC